jgi:hypothetical protein
MITEMNCAHSKLSLRPERVEQLAIELDQLANAIESVRGSLRFDGEPCDFRVALIDLSKDASDD